MFMHSIKNFVKSECFADHYLINYKNYDFSLSILFKERVALFFWQPPVYIKKTSCKKISISFAGNINF